ncbi:hypothetical protein ACO2JO_12315 [Leptospira interrogans]
MSKFTGVAGWAALARTVRLFMVTPAAIEASIILRRVSIGVLPVRLMSLIVRIATGRVAGRSLRKRFPILAPGVISRGRARETIELRALREGRLLRGIDMAANRVAHFSDKLWQPPRSVETQNRAGHCGKPRLMFRQIAARFALLVAGSPFDELRQFFIRISGIIVR